MEAAKCLPSYQLGVGQNCKERVESLLQDLRFHIPGTWGGDNGNVSIREFTLCTKTTLLYLLGMDTRTEGCIQTSGNS